MTIYFAYGSNLLPRQMEERCPDAPALGTAVLEGYRFLIGERGFATLSPDPESRVHGVLWTLTPGHEATLDRKEGVALGLYRKAWLPVLTPDGPVENVLVYIDDRTSPAPPKEGYLEKITEGASHFGLPSDYIDFLESHGNAA